MPYKRTGTSKWWITVNGVRQSSGTDDFEAAKALEAKLNHQHWLQENMDVEPAHSWMEAVVKYLQERQRKPRALDRRPVERQVRRLTNTEMKHGNLCS